MYQLLRVRYESVGHPEARFDPLELDFRGEAGERPQDAVLWLRNGGGKTSLLALFFALLQPRRDDFLGGRRSLRRNTRPKLIEDYVGPDDVAHVVAEWGRPAEGSQLGFAGCRPLERLVTGQVLAWRRSGGGNELERWFYAFHPEPGLLELDDLPFRRDVRHRTPAREFLDYLRRQSQEAPPLGVVVTDNQRAWREYLESEHLDPEVYRYQLAMNEHEGGAEEFLDFRDGNSFVAFFLRLVTDPARIETVEGNIRKVAEHFAERPQLELELAFVEGVLEHTPGLVAARDGLAAARASRDALLGDVRRLLARLTSAESTARREQEAEDRRAAELDREWRATERDRNTWQDRVAALEEVVARFRLAEAREVLAAARARAQERRREVEAWALVDRVLDERRARSQVAALRAELARAESDAADLRRSYEEATARYRVRLRRQLAAETERRESAAQEAAAAEARAEAGRAAAAEAGEAAARLRAEQAALEEKLAEADARRARLARAGALRPEETVAEALGRVERELALVSGRLSALDARRAARDEEQEALRARGAERASRVAELVEQLRGLNDQRAALERRLEALGGQPEVQELTGGQPVDLLARAPALLEQLAERAAEVDRALVELEVDAQESRRELLALRTTGLLPPSRDVEHACQLLEPAGISATSGWQYLAQNVRAEERERLVSRHPDLVAGVVVNDGDLERASACLEASLVPAQPLTLSESSAWAAALDGTDQPAGRRVLPASTAHHNAARAAEERVRCEDRASELEARRGRLEERRGRLRRVAAELARLQEESPAGGLAAVERQIAEREARLAAQRAEAEGESARLRELTVERERDSRERGEREREQARLFGLRGELAAAESLDADVAKWRPKLADVIKALREAGERQRRASATVARERAVVEDARRRAAEAGDSCASLRTVIRGLPAVGESVEVADDPAVSTQRLEQEHRAARDRYELKTSRSETALRLRVAEERLEDLVGQLASYHPDVLRRATELLDGPDGLTPEARQAAAARARDQDAEAQRRVGACDQSVSQAERELEGKSAALVGKRVALPPELTAESQAEAGEYLAEATTRHAEARERRTILDGQLIVARGHSAQARERADVLQLLAGSIRTSQEERAVELQP